ncbi:hypothetical protein HG530_010522 [Fusarium avenaceum]|nr:hypothetical protein HG530_010522 [Fusarium avenaceum]
MTARLELDAVDEWFPSSLDVEEVCELQGKDGDVEQDDEDVYQYQMVQYHLEPAALLEAAEDVGIEFEDIVEGDADEDCDYDGNAAALGVDFGHVERRGISWRG